MTDYIYVNLKADFLVYGKDARTGQWNFVSPRANLDENTKYKMNVKVSNVGSETFMKNVQIRVTNSNPSRIQYYTDESCGTKCDRLDSPIYFKDKVMNPGDSTDTHSVYFMVKEGPDQNAAAIAHYGIYAEIVPQGHAWNTETRPLD